MGYGFSEDIICFGASCAYGAAYPLKALDAILSRWKEAGVKTLQEAQEQNKNLKRATKKAGNAAIDERSYAPGELDALVYDPIEEILRQQNQE